MIFSVTVVGNTEREMGSLAGTKRRDKEINSLFDMFEDWWVLQCEGAGKEKFQETGNLPIWGALACRGG